MNSVLGFVVALCGVVLYLIACYEIGCITEKIRSGWFSTGFWYAVWFGPFVLTIPIIWWVAHLFNFKESLDIQKEILNSQRAIRKKLYSN